MIHYLTPPAPRRSSSKGIFRLDPRLWLLDAKMNGIRVEVIKQPSGKLELWNRHDSYLSYSKGTSELTKLLTDLPDGIRLDGEWMRGQGYYLFDITHLDGRDLSTMPFAKRRSILTVVAHKVRLPVVESIGDFFSNFYEHCREAGHEGVVAKKLDSIYRSGGSVISEWRKRRFEWDTRLLRQAI